MADAKITQLPAATTPLAGTEVLPVVQGGVTDQVSVANLTAGRSVSVGNISATSSSIPTNGVYLPAANTLGFATNSANNLNLSTNLALGTTVDATISFLNANNITGGTTAYGNRTAAAIQSGVTALGVGYSSHLSTAAAAFTTTAVHYYRASQGTIGASSAVTSQMGYYVDSSLTGATNNYGFHGNLAVSGSANWNLYAAGTAPNFMAGPLNFGSTTLAAGRIMFLQTAATGATSISYVLLAPVAQSDVTTSISLVQTSPATAAAAFTLGTLRHFSTSQGTIGAGSAVTTQQGFYADSSLTGATNNYGFYGNLAAATGRWNLYMVGTAQNAVAGPIRFGSVTAPVNTVDITGSLGRGAPVTKSADFTLAATENWLINNKSGSTCTVTLPTASSWTGREVMFQNYQAQTVISASSNVCPLGSATPGTAILASGAGKWCTMVSDGTNWIIMQGN